MSFGHKLIVRGIVIGKTQAGEGSLKVKIYTDALGLIMAFAKSAKEERSQLRAHLEVGTHGGFSLVKGKDVWRVTGAAHTTNAHFALSGNASAQLALARVLSFVRQFVHGEGNDPYLFAALWSFVHALPRLLKEEMQDAEYVCVLRMLAALGYVEDTKDTNRFLNAPFSSTLLEEMKKARPMLLKAINGAITESGLS